MAIAEPTKNPVKPTFGIKYKAKYESPATSIPIEAISFLPNFLTSGVAKGIAANVVPV